MRLKTSWKLLKLVLWISVFALAAALILAWKSRFVHAAVLLSTCAGIGIGVCAANIGIIWNAREVLRSALSQRPAQLSPGQHEFLDIIAKCAAGAGFFLTFLVTLITALLIPLWDKDVSADEARIKAYSEILRPIEEFSKAEEYGHGEGHRGEFWAIYHSRFLPVASGDALTKCAEVYAAARGWTPQKDEAVDKQNTAKVRVAAEAAKQAILDTLKRQ